MPSAVEPGRPVKRAVLVAALEQAESQRTRLQGLVDALTNAPVGVFHTDPTGQMIYANKRWGEITGLGEINALSGWASWVHPDDRVRVDTAWAVAFGTGQEYRDRFRVVGGDGAIRWLDVGAVALRDTTGAITGYVGTTADVTSDVAGEESARTSRDAALTASRLKSQFLANMSHEIRSPMNGVLGMAELLLDTRLDATQRNYLLVLRDSGKNLLEIIDDILDFSKVEAGKVKLEDIDFALPKVVEAVVSLSDALARRKNIALHLDVSEEVPSWVRGDPVRVRQVLTNLVTNAVKFTEAGEVRVTVRCPTPGRVRFEVRDTGIGIDSEGAARLGDPFAQAEASTTRRFGGSGLGLAISRQLLEVMGGELHYRSRPGHGSTFWFDVPLPAAQEPDESEKTGTVDADFLTGWSGSGARVLLVDDSEVNQMVARAMLERLGYNVDLAENGAQAVASVRSTRYDLVLMDCLMPVMDGYEATARIRRLKGPARLTPIIAVTASAMPGDREKCLAAGMDDYVSKPLDRATLALALTRCHSGQRASAGDTPRGVDPAVEAASPTPARAAPVSSAGAESAAGASEVVAPAPRGPNGTGAVTQPGASADTSDISEGLRHLQRQVGAVAFAGVCDVFLRSVPDRIAQLTQAVAGGDIATVSGLAHTLKGTAASFQAVRLSELAERVEEMCQDGGDRLGWLADQLDEEFARVSAAMDALVGH